MSKGLSPLYGIANPHWLIPRRMAGETREFPIPRTPQKHQFFKKILTIAFIPENLSAFNARRIIW